VIRLFLLLGEARNPLSSAFKLRIDFKGGVVIICCLFDLPHRFMSLSAATQGVRIGWMFSKHSRKVIDGFLIFIASNTSCPD
jgi:hypothetical protein